MPDQTPETRCPGCDGPPGPSPMAECIDPFHNRHPAPPDLEAAVERCAEMDSGTNCEGKGHDGGHTWRPTNEEQEVTRERGDGGQWERVTEWQTVQPIHCTRCGHTYEGREAGYLPAMCDEPDCAIPIDPRRVVTVRIATEPSR